MRTSLSFLLLLSISTPALADDPPPPHCLITRIHQAGDSDAGTSTSIDVPGVYAKGPRWAEYNCRQDSRALAKSWVSDHGGCASGHVSFKYTLALGQPGSESMIDMSVACPSGGSSGSSGSSSGYHEGDKVNAEWHGKYYPATILRVVEKDRYFIHYDGYSSSFDETVGPSRLAPR